MPYKIEVPEEIRGDVEANWIGKMAAVNRGEVPNYPMFVQELFKELGSLSDTIHHAATGIAGEGGELLDASKKLWAYNKPLDVENLLEELGDLRFYYQALLNMLDLTDQEIQAINMRKLLKRYPDGVYSDKAAQERADKNDS